MRIKTFRYFACDFETTVYDNQEFTEVWASACVELNTEDVKIFHSIDETFEYFCSLKCNVCAYYHNLKFDGAFWLSYLMTKLKFKQASKLIHKNAEEYQIEWIEDKYMQNNTFKYSISDMGQWYSIIIKKGNKIIEIRDSLKLLPFSIKRIGDSFNTKHKKLEMDYKGFRYAGCDISEEEKRYISNDVLVLKEALEFMFSEGHNSLTIGSCCLKEYKYLTGTKQYQAMFPNIYEIPLDEDVYGSQNAGEYIRKSYKGGWCYLVRDKEDKIYHDGLTADVNSLYPSMMSSESGNWYPIGNPHFWSGNYIPDDAIDFYKYYFIRIKTRFYLKENKLPFIQIKGSWLYAPNDCLETSDIVDIETGEAFPYYKDLNGNRKEAKVILTLTMIDFRLFLEHYNAVDMEILDGCWFVALQGIFDKYIEKYKKIKLESKGAKRELAKLFLNNLYGKMASNTNSSFKVAYVKEDGAIGFMPNDEYNKKPGYIPIGSAITSYARNFTIRTAQKNYYGKDKRGFIYADTDSIHCDLKPEELKGVNVHDKNFCCWKLEAYWDEAIFIRQKTYIEHVTHVDGECLDAPYYNVKCAGMPQRCKELFLRSMKGENGAEDDSEEAKEFLKTKRELKDFNVGLKVPGKLLPKRIKGGVVLVDTYYEMR